MADDLTHFDTSGRPRMVDVSDKTETSRNAIARGHVVFSRDAFAQVQARGVKKGDLKNIAELAGVMGAKHTANLIPLCHPLPITGVSVEIEPDDELPGFIVTAEVKTVGKTGVEMEALTAVMTSCLTIYDMVKAIDKSMIIEDVKLLEKSGGKSGDYQRDR